MEKKTETIKLQKQLSDGPDLEVTLKCACQKTGAKCQKMLWHKKYKIFLVAC